jgi:hypothetical protein
VLRGCTCIAGYMGTIVPAVGRTGFNGSCTSEDGILTSGGVHVFVWMGCGHMLSRVVDPLVSRTRVSRQLPAGRVGRSAQLCVCGWLPRRGAIAARGPAVLHARLSRYANGRLAVTCCDTQRLAAVLLLSCSRNECPRTHLDF